MSSDEETRRINARIDDVVGVVVVVGESTFPYFYLDVALALSSDGKGTLSFKVYKKPNVQTKYMNVKSNHFPHHLKHLFHMVFSFLLLLLLLLMPCLPLQQEQLRTENKNSSLSDLFPTYHDKSVQDDGHNNILETQQLKTLGAGCCY